MSYGSFSLTGDFKFEASVYTNSVPPGGTDGVIWVFSTKWGDGGGLNLDLYHHHTEGPRAFIQNCVTDSGVVSQTALKPSDALGKQPDKWVQYTVERRSGAVSFSIDGVVVDSVPTCTGTITASPLVVGSVFTSHFAPALMGAFEVRDYEC